MKKILYLPESKYIKRYSHHSAKSFLPILRNRLIVHGKITEHLVFEDGTDGYFELTYTDLNSFALVEVEDG